MGNRVESHTGRTAPDGASVAAGPQELVRLLLKSAQPACPSPDDQGTNSEEIVMDISVDGFRYMLVRMPLLQRGSQIVLSPREQEIARMVAKGHQNKIIAEVLSISSWTVCTHMRRIFAKLGVNSRAAMVDRLHEMEFAQREGQGTRSGR